MKLHLGCGKNYKNGYINIDQYDSTVADQSDSITNLKFKDNSIDTIEAYHILEHLSYYSSIFGLYEWFRVLKPTGKLIMEIPHLERTFQKFLEGDSKVKNRLLVWVYGRQKPGMSHKFIYYKELLEEKLSEIGFVNIKMKEYDDIKGRPVLRIICQKTNKNLQYLQLIAKLRNMLHLKNVFNKVNEDSFGEFEEILRLFGKGVEKYLKSGKIFDFESIIKQLIISHPIITEIILDACQGEGLIDNSYYKKVMAINDKLKEINFSKINFNLITEAPILPGEQFEVFEKVKLIIETLINKFFRIGIKNFENNFQDLVILSNRLKPLEDVPFFLPSLIQSRANAYYFEGLKYYKRHEYGKAIAKFAFSLKLDRNNFFTFLNLARLYAKIASRAKAMQYFQFSMKILEFIKVKRKKIIRKYLQLVLDSLNMNKNFESFDRPFENFIQIIREMETREEAY